MKQRIKIPRETSIGAYPYKLVYTENKLADTNNLGTTSTTRLTIDIEPNMHDRVKAVTLWHEYLEGINDVSRLGLECKDMDCIAHGIVQILMDSWKLEFDWSDIT